MNICKALVAASAEIGGAIKDSTNPHFRSGYASLEAVIDTVKPSLLKHGLTFVQKILEGEDAKVETILIHESGETLSFGVCDVPLDKKNPQGYGSALTYARRYSLLTAFGVPTVDDDGNAASAPQGAYKYRMPEELTEKQLTYLRSFAYFDEKEKVWVAPKPDAALSKYLVGKESEEERSLKQRGQVR